MKFKQFVPALVLVLGLSGRAADNFADRDTMSGLGWSAFGDFGGGGEAGEPQHGGLDPAYSQWYRWVAPFSTKVQLDTSSSTVYTVVAVYTGSAVDSLTRIADDTNGGTDVSFVMFDAVEGVEYNIVIDLGFGDISPYVLNLNIFPPNDNFANRIVITSSDARFESSNVLATVESGEQNDHSVWYSWTAPADIEVTMDTIGSNLDTYLEIDTGNSIDSLIFFAGDDDSGGNKTSQLTFLASAGETYQICIDGVNNARGLINFHLRITTPANDNFANRNPLAGLDIEFGGHTFNATAETPFEAGYETIWWSWIAPADCTVSLDTTPADLIEYGTAVITGDPASDAVEVASGQTLQFNAVKGTEYHIVFYTSKAGETAVSLLLRVEPPANDRFANRIEIFGNQPLTGHNLNSGAEGGEPDLEGLPAYASVWWKFVATAPGTTVITTEGSELDTLLGVYTGNAVDSLTLVESNDNEGLATTSRLAFIAAVGTEYQIVVDLGIDGGPGPIRLLVVPNAAPVASAAGVSGTEDLDVSGNLSASDANADTLTYSIVAQPNKGTVNLNSGTGEFTYSPNTNTNGTDTFTFKASDGFLDSNVETVTITLAMADDPTDFTSAPGATPSTAKVEAQIQFSVGATDPDGSLTFTWNFGDGATATGANVTHAYATAGTFVVVLTAADPQNGSTTRTLSVTITAEVFPSLKSLKLATKLNFAKANSDTLGLVGVVGAEGPLTGQTLVFDAAGVRRTFTLDAKGKSTVKSGTETASASVSAPKGGIAKFSIKISKAALASAMAPFGYTNETTSKSFQTSVKIILGNRAFISQVNQTYKAKQGKSGQAK